MLDSIHVGMTGLVGYSKGLRVIANNTANLNTPGYKTSSLQFSDSCYARTDVGDGRSAQLGQGLSTTGTRLDFRQGDLRQTGNAFDLGVEGEGLFTLRGEDGQLRYTRAGQFDFDQDGVLVNRADRSKVVGLDAAGRQADISLAGLKVAAGKPTATARFTGNLSSSVTEHSVSAVKVFDSLGEERVLSLKFNTVGAAGSGAWNVELLDGTTSLGTAQLTFVDGRPAADSAKPTFTYQPAGRAATQLTLDFSSDVTSFASGNLSSLALASQDGYAPGSLGQVSFDAAGTLVATYSNGQTAKGARLLLGRFRSTDAVEQAGGNQFKPVEGKDWDHGGGGDAAFGSVRAGVVEVSNVDLSREFSDLVILQRGYQASSQVIATANDMLQELFRMKAK